MKHAEELKSESSKLLKKKLMMKKRLRPKLSNALSLDRSSSNTDCPLTSFSTQTVETRKSDPTKSAGDFALSLQILKYCALRSVRGEVWRCGVISVVLSISVLSNRRGAPAT